MLYCRTVLPVRGTQSPLFNGLGMLRSIAKFAGFLLLLMISAVNGSFAFDPLGSEERDGEQLSASELLSTDAIVLPNRRSQPHCGKRSARHSGFKESLSAHHFFSADCRHGGDPARHLLANGLNAPLRI